VHKLFTSCIRRCLVSRACYWVMSALSAVLHIYSFQFRSVFLPRQSARRHSGVLGLPNIEHRASPKNWGGFLHGVYSQGEWLWIDANGKNGMKTRHAVEGSFGNEFPAICNHCGVLAAWSRKTKLFKEFFCVFLEKWPVTEKFSKFCLESFRGLTDRRFV